MFKVSAEIPEAIRLDVDLVGWPAGELESTAEPVPFAVQVLDPDVGCARIEVAEDRCFLVKLRIVLVTHSCYRKSLKG